VCNHHNH
jgi:hypothetical protein